MSKIITKLMIAILLCMITTNIQAQSVIQSARQLQEDHENRVSGIAAFADIQLKTATIDYQSKLQRLKQSAETTKNKALLAELSSMLDNSDIKTIDRRTSNLEFTTASAAYSHKLSMYSGGKIFITSKNEKDKSGSRSNTIGSWQVQKVVVIRVFAPFYSNKPTAMIIILIKEDNKIKMYMPLSNSRSSEMITQTAEHLLN